MESSSRMVGDRTRQVSDLDCADMAKVVELVQGEGKSTTSP